jgi:hypothetical protein
MKTLLAAVAVLVLATACSEDSGPNSTGETHFIRCESDLDCASLEVPHACVERRCVAQSAAGCIDQYSLENGYGAPADAPMCTSPPPPAPEPVCEPPTPESVASDCAAAGVTCDPAEFITREAAECIALLAGLEAGLEPWSADLFYARDLGRPVWSIRNLTLDDASNCTQDGRSLRIDAITGDAEAISRWRSIC